MTNHAGKQDVHNLVRAPLLNKVFHVLFSFISFGSLTLPLAPDAPKPVGKVAGIKQFLGRLKGAEYQTTGPWQAIEVHASKYLIPLAGGLAVAGCKKSALATVATMSSLSAVGNAMDSFRLFRQRDKKDHIAIGLGRLARGLMYGSFAAYFGGLAHVAHATMAPAN